MLQRHCLLLALFAGALCAPPTAPAQLSTPQAQPVASVSTEGVTLHGAISVSGGRAELANNGDVTAGDHAAKIALTRGGSVLLCQSTTIHIAKDAGSGAAAKPNDAGLMISLDRGALETSYTPGAYADVILTPDLRLLISSPGMARVKLRVNGQGDTCVDNSGAEGPYVVASSLMDGGIYRVQPGQRVLFVHGSLQQVVDNEKEPCGCPAPAPVTDQQAANIKAGGPSSTAADTAFPTAVSEGLQAPPVESGNPVVPQGFAHAQVAATLSSNTPPTPPPAAADNSAQGSKAVASPPAAQASSTGQPLKPHHGIFGSIGHFFAKVFGAK